MPASVYKDEATGISYDLAREEGVPIGPTKESCAKYEIPFQYDIRAYISNGRISLVFWELDAHLFGEWGPVKEWSISAEKLRGLCDLADATPPRVYGSVE